jgi:hypothetical protein
MAKNNKLAATVSLAVFAAFLLLPAISFAYSLGDPLVPTCAGRCEWKDLLTLINNLITFTLKFMVVPIAAIMFAYAGLIMVTSGSESASAWTKAKSIFLNTAIGLVLALAAWLIVRLVLTILGWEGSWIGF